MFIFVGTYKNGRNCDNFNAIISPYLTLLSTIFILFVAQNVDIE